MSLQGWHFWNESSLWNISMWRFCLCTMHIMCACDVLSIWLSSYCTVWKDFSASHSSFWSIASSIVLLCTSIHIYPATDVHVHAFVLVKVEIDHLLLEAMQCFWMKIPLRRHPEQNGISILLCCLLSYRTMMHFETMDVRSCVISSSPKNLVVGMYERGNVCVSVTCSTKVNWYVTTQCILLYNSLSCFILYVSMTIVFVVLLFW